MLDIEEFKKKLDKKSRLIGIDPGKRLSRKQDFSIQKKMRQDP